MTISFDTLQEPSTDLLELVEKACYQTFLHFGIHSYESMMAYKSDHPDPKVALLREALVSLTNLLVIAVSAIREKDSAELAFTFKTIMNFPHWNLKRLDLMDECDVIFRVKVCVVAINRYMNKLEQPTKTYNASMN